eukprot:4388751-Pleurochrysis_carterae.AAC.1
MTRWASCVICSVRVSRSPDDVTTRETRARRSRSCGSLRANTGRSGHIRAGKLGGEVGWLRGLELGGSSVGYLGVGFE